MIGVRTIHANLRRVIYIYIYICIYIHIYISAVTSKLDLNLRKKLVKCYVWSMALYGAQTWTLWATDQKRLESFEMWCWRRMEKIS